MLVILLWVVLQFHLGNCSKVNSEKENYLWVMDRFVTMDDRSAMPSLNEGDVITFHILREEDRGFLSSIDCLNLGGWECPTQGKIECKYNVFKQWDCISLLPDHTVLAIFGPTCLWTEDGRIAAETCEIGIYVNSTKPIYPKQDIWSDPRFKKIECNTHHH